VTGVVSDGFGEHVELNGRAETGEIQA